MWSDAVPTSRSIYAPKPSAGRTQHSIRIRPNSWVGRLTPRKNRARGPFIQSVLREHHESIGVIPSRVELR